MQMGGELNRLARPPTATDPLRHLRGWTLMDADGQEGEAGKPTESAKNKEGETEGLAQRAQRSRPDGSRMG